MECNKAGAVLLKNGPGRIQWLELFKVKVMHKLISFSPSKLDPNVITGLNVICKLKKISSKECRRKLILSNIW